MPSRLKVRLSRKRTLLVALAIGLLVYVFMPSCALLADEDDTLCHALAAAKDGVVTWPVDERWHSDSDGGCHVFDSVMTCRWWSDPDARAYIEGFGLAQGHNWDDLGRADVTTYDKSSFEIDTPLGRTYNGYANIVYASHEGRDLDRSRSLGDFEYYDSFLKWASAFVAQKTYRINGNCFRSCEAVGSYSCAIAKTTNGAFRNDYIDFYQTFFYDIDAIWRASTIVHEVRHARDQVLHSGGGACPRRSACDTRWSSAGSNTYEMMWLAAYYWAPFDNSFVTEARRARAQTLFETLRQYSFGAPVRWRLLDFAQINEIPEFYVQEVACSEDPENPYPCIFLSN